MDAHVSVWLDDILCPAAPRVSARPVNFFGGCCSLAAWLAGEWWSSFYLAVGEADVELVPCIV